MAFILDIPRRKNCVRCGDQDNYIFPYHVIRLWVHRMNGQQREQGGRLGIDFSLIPLDAQAAVAVPNNNSNEQHTGGGGGSCPTFTIEMQGQHTILPHLFCGPRKLRIYEAPPQPPIHHSGIEKAIMLWGGLLRLLQIVKGWLGIVPTTVRRPVSIELSLGTRNRGRYGHRLWRGWWWSTPASYNEFFPTDSLLSTFYSLFHCCGLCRVLLALVLCRNFRCPLPLCRYC